MQIFDYSKGEETDILRCKIWHYHQLLMNRNKVVHFRLERHNLDALDLSGRKYVACIFFCTVIPFGLCKC